MKRIITVFVLLVLTCMSANAKSDQAQIRDVLKSHQIAVKNNDIEKIKSFYDKNYTCSDGFKLDELLSLYQKSYESYSDIKYKTKINSINVYGNWAIVRMSDDTKAMIYTDSKKQDKKTAGVLDGKSIYSMYMIKSDGDWKILYEDITMEETVLKYGIAKKLKMELVSPPFIENGEEYNLALNIDKPQNIIALASLNNEEVKFPTPDINEKYRKIPSEGDLQRIVRANTNNLDEYAIASVGLTRVLLNEDETRARIEIVGVAYIMKRIGMLPKKAVL